MMSIKKVSALLAAVVIVASGTGFAGGLSGPGPIAVYSQYPGGSKSNNAVTVATAVKTSNGILYRVIPNVLGSSGTLTIVDDAFLGAYSATATYQLGQSVSSGGSVYYALQQTSGNAPTGGSPNWSAANTPPAAQVIFSGAYNALTINVPLVLDWPCQYGIYFAVVPSAGSPSYAVSYF